MALFKNSLFSLFLFLLCGFTTLKAPSGITFQKIHHNEPRQEIYVLEVDPTLVVIRSVKAKADALIGRKTVLDMVKEHGAYAGINGGFFHGGKKDGMAAGILKIDYIWYGYPSKPRGAIGWTNGQDALIDRVLYDESVYTPYTIPPERALSWNSFRFIVGGTPVLIRDGLKIVDFSLEKTQESFLLKRHARSSVGIKENGHWVFVVVDRSFPWYSVGMTMDELASFMLSLGCIEALNLDGGGSSTMCVDNKVVNYSFGDIEEGFGFRMNRKVSDAILLFIKNER